MSRRRLCPEDFTGPTRIPLFENRASMRNCPMYLCVLITLGLTANVEAFGPGPLPMRQLILSHCMDCHQGESPEAGLDLQSLGSDLSDPKTFGTWVKVFDRIASGEMPPPSEAEPIEASQRSRFLTDCRDWLQEYQREQQQVVGRVPARRLTNLQLERTLQDLLGIDIPLSREMPEEPDTGHYSTVAEMQSISHFQLEQHLKIVDLALDEAFRRALTPSDHQIRRMSAKEISRTRTRTREPEYIDNAAVTWSSTLAFYGRLPATTADEDGWYRFRFQVSALNKPADQGVWSTIRSGQCVSSAPLMSWIGSFEATAVPREIVVEAWLPRGHMLEIRPGDRTLKMARFQGGQSADGEGGSQNVPGIQIDWMDKERIHLSAGDDQIREWLFGDLEVDTARTPEDAKIQVANPRQTGHALVEQFAHRAFRRPATPEQLSGFKSIFDTTLRTGIPFTDALRSSYRAVLCSPRFLYFHEQPGKLDDYAIASRLSFLLWNSMPDTELIQLADAGRLSDPEVIRGQVSRMLETSRGRHFVEDFAREWLELSQIDFTEPDREQHPDFDMIVQHSMLDETHSFLQFLLSQNASLDHFVDCDFTFLNSRLARFYGLEGVEGDEVRQVALNPGDRRGGLLSQGAILKVTANGTNTSPVIRGVWVSKRILGQDVPPPPDSVPAIEPDIRGAKSIREQLEKHRSQPDCAVCHRKVDAPGFALENYDAAGKWRDFYPKKSGKGITKGSRIDASYTTAAGEEFEDVLEFRKIAAARPEVLAANLAKHLLIYGTGADISFADREEIEQIVRRAEQNHFGMRSILDEVVLSRIFLSK